MTKKEAPPIIGSHLLPAKKKQKEKISAGKKMTY